MAESGRSHDRGRPSVPRTVDTMVGRVRLERPYFYCRVCREGVYPLAEPLSLSPGRIQLDVQHAAARFVVPRSYAAAREQIEERIAKVVAGKWRRPVMVLGIDGAYAPTRPESARGRRPGQKRQRVRRPTWKGQWREVKGFRFYLIDGERIVHLLSWHQIQNETELGEALKAVKEAGLIPEDRVRLCVVCDGAS